MIVSIARVKDKSYHYLLKSHTFYLQIYDSPRYINASTDNCHSVFAGVIALYKVVH